MIILVTGVMRSGTSLISKQLHLMGIPMGTEMRFPINGQEDWEDVVFTDKMLDSIFDQMEGSFDRVKFKNWLKKYEDDRNEKEIWGVKSPFALPFVEEIRDAFSADLKVVLTTRDVESVTKSLLRQPVDLETLLVLQNELYHVLDTVKFDLSIDITESWNTPDIVKSKLQNLVRS